MARFSANLLLVLAVVVLLASPAAAFGAGNIASVAKIEGQNWRHGDIEDMLKTIAFLHGRRWSSMMVKRVYFGNWLRDYSQAMDVGSLKGVKAETIRVLVWILAFLSFGYATEEFEVTSERLGVYRPEEHIDNPKDYADNQDARKFDPRLRGPVEQIELDIDPATGMKNYIANEKLGIATSAGYVKFSLTRSIHFGRVYTCGASGKGKEADLCEALRCLGQALHCMEDFGAHTNYVELALREMGYNSTFTHTGTATEIDLRGRRVFPLVTGTFGVVDFLHSVLGEATDHFAQTEVDQMNKALEDAENMSRGSATRDASGSAPLASVTSLLSQVPGAGGLAREAEQLQAQSAEQTRVNDAGGMPTGAQQPLAQGQSPQANTAAAPAAGANPNVIPGTNIDPTKIAGQIYPILAFRDRIAKMINESIEKVPGLEKILEKISDTITLFILSLLAPYIRPIINVVSKQLQFGSSGVVDASGRHQYEPWDDPHCTDPTHSLLSKDHFSNILNEPAGQVATTILQYVAPRILYAWQHPDVPVEQVLDDVLRAFHHPAIRDPSCEIHEKMFATVSRWSHSRPDGGSNLHWLLNSDSVRTGKNHTVTDTSQHFGQGGILNQAIPHIPTPHIPGMNSVGKIFGLRGAPSSSPWGMINKFREMPGDDGPGGFSRELPDFEKELANAYPGTQTAHETAPAAAPVGFEPGWSGQQDPYAQAPYPPQPSAPEYYQGGAPAPAPGPSGPPAAQGYGGYADPNLAPQGSGAGYGYGYGYQGGPTPGGTPPQGYNPLYEGWQGQAPAPHQHYGQYY